MALDLNLDDLDMYALANSRTETAREGGCETCGSALRAERPPQVPAAFCSAACYHEQRRLLAWTEGLLRLQFAGARPTLLHGLPRC